MSPTAEATPTWEQVLRWRMHRHLLADERGEDPAGIARRICGLHAQLAASAVTSARLRSRRPATVTADRLDHALTAERSLVKTWAARGTLHLLPAADLPTWTAALSLRGTEQKGSWLRYHNLTALQVTEVLEAIAEVLDATPVTRPELADRIIAATGHDDLHDLLTQGFGPLLKPAAARGLLCFGPPRGRHVTFVAPRHWLPRWSEPDPESALDTLVLAHLASYGPADAAEFARWFGLNPPPVKRALARLTDRVAWVEVDGRRGAVPREQLPVLRDPPGGTGVHLLPAFDPYVVGSLRQLDRVMTGGERVLVSRPQGWISPALVVDGRIAGTWEQESDGGRLTITVTPFGELSRAARAGLDDAAARLADGDAGAALRYR
jgi:hypothetical protein